LHSFNADDIRGDVHMRLSKKGEKILTLDNVERELPNGALIMNDDEGIFDLLGIMGGLRSSTTPDTKNIFIHALSIDPATIRRAVIATGHRTDAATVYEKGVPPVTTERGFMRAVELFCELIPGATIASSLLSEGTNGTPPTIPLSVEKVNARIGAKIPEQRMIEILEDLGCTVKKGPAKGTLTVTAAPHRMRDIAGDHDLIEEIGRIFGYENVENVMPTAELRIPERDQRIHRMRDALKGIGYMETVPLSFVSKQLLEKSGCDPALAVEIENPLGDETALLQTSTLPHLLAHAEKNLLAAGTLRTFHWSHVFEKGKPEHLELSMMIVTRENTGLLDDPFLQTKEDMLGAIKAAGYDVTITSIKDVPSYAHPGRIATIMLGKEAIGNIFEVHPSIRAHFDLPNRAAAATVNLHALLKHPPAAHHAQEIPLFPAVVYDVTLTRTHKDNIDTLLQKAKNELLESVVIHDLYAGKPLTDGQYNVTLRFTYRSPERTLTEDEAKAAHEKVVKAIS
jgi:phenylalanyl-tRNA synthetase beta chain